MLANCTLDNWDDERIFRRRALVLCAISTDLDMMIEYNKQSLVRRRVDLVEFSIVYRANNQVQQEHKCTSVLHTTVHELNVQVRYGPYTKTDSIVLCVHTQVMMLPSYIKTIFEMKILKTTTRHKLERRSFANNEMEKISSSIQMKIIL